MKLTQLLKLLLKYFSIQVMKYLLLFFLVIGVTNSKGQSAEKKYIDELIEYSRKQSRNAYYQNLYEKIDTDTLISRTLFSKEILQHLISEFTNDTVENVRAIGYAMVNKLNSNGSRETDEEIKKAILLKLLSGCLDENKEIRRRNLGYITDQNHWSSSGRQDKKVAESLKTVLVRFPDEISYSIVNMIGKYEITSLKAVLKDNFTPFGSHFKNKYGSTMNYYNSKEWATWLALGRMNDDKAIQFVINKLQNENDLDLKYSQTNYVSSYIGGLKVAQFVYQLYMSDEGLKTTEPLGRYAGTPPPNPTFLERYLNPPLIFKHQWPQHLAMEAKQCEGIQDVSDKEICAIMVTRKWLSETRGSWKVLRE